MAEGWQSARSSCRSGSNSSTDPAYGIGARFRLFSAEVRAARLFENHSGTTCLEAVEFLRSAKF